MPKSVKRDASDEKPTAETVLDTTIDGLHRGAEYLRGRMDMIIDGKGGKSKFDPESRVAHLMTKLGSVADSVRKAEAARAKRLDAITSAMVVAWFRALDPTERQRLVRELQQLDSKRSGLA